MGSEIRQLIPLNTYFYDYHWNGVDCTFYNPKYEISGKIWVFLFESNALGGSISCHAAGVLVRIGFLLWLKWEAIGE